MTRRQSKNQPVFVDEETMIFSGLGGEGNRLRSYFALSTKNFAPLTQIQREHIKDGLTILTDKFEIVVEEIEFGMDYILVKVLVPIDEAVGDVVDGAIITINKIEDIFRFHYLCVNTQKPSKREIKEYLQIAAKECGEIKN